MPHCRGQLEKAPFLRGDNERYYSEEKVIEMESRLPGLLPYFVSRPCCARVFQSTAENLDRAFGHP